VSHLHTLEEVVDLLTRPSADKMCPVNTSSNIKLELTICFFFF